jgi:hypothetical protein
MNDLYTEIIALKFRNSSSRAPPECVKGSELHYVSEVWRVWGSELHYVSEVWRVWVWGIEVWKMGPCTCKKKNWYCD